MSEIKCPCCDIEFTFIEGEFFICHVCLFRVSVDYLPRIAAAMELAKAESWFMETEYFDWSGPLREENEDAFREWDSINYKAGEDLNKAQQRVLEVFNG